MRNPRYDYLPIINRKKIVWPNDGRVALWVAPNIEYFHFDMPIRGSGSNHAPDVPGYTLRDYGSRVGVFRIMEVLDKYGIRASVLLNAEVCEQHPPIIEEGNKRRWEWLGHGMTNSISMLEQPVPLRVKSGHMIVVPYELGVNDIRVFIREGHTPEQYYRMICDQFDTLYRDSVTGGRVLCLPLHPFVIGMPYRIKYLEKVLDYICSHDGVWRTTGWEIAEWYYRHYYVDPGRMEG